MPTATANRYSVSATIRHQPSGSASAISRAGPGLPSRISPTVTPFASRLLAQRGQVVGVEVEEDRLLVALDRRARVREHQLRVATLERRPIKAHVVLVGVFQLEPEQLVESDRARDVRDVDEWDQVAHALAAHARGRRRTP